MSRRALQIQRAVRKNPLNPDFLGLESYLLHMTDSTGVAPTPLFDGHIANLARADAQVMKQFRKNREELALTHTSCSLAASSADQPEVTAANAAARTAQEKEKKEKKAAAKAKAKAAAGN